MTFTQIVSTIPESHLCDARKDAEITKLAYRTDAKGREFVSFRDDVSRLEWKISKSHTDTGKAAAHISQWIGSQDINLSIVVAVPESKSAVFAKEQIEFVESVCSGFLVGKSLGELSASAWQVVGDTLDDMLATGASLVPSSSFTEEEVVPETTSVRLKSVLDFQRFLRRLERYSDPKGMVFIRFVLFKESRIVHFAFLHANRANSVLASVPTIRAARKTGSVPRTPALGLSERCLVALLAGNAKPFIVMDASGLSDSNAVTYQSLFDVAEKICLTALPCQREPAGLKIEDFEILDSVDKLPPRKTATDRTQSIISIDNSSDESKTSSRVAVKVSVGGKSSVPASRKETRRLTPALSQTLPIASPPCDPEAQLTEDISNLDTELSQLALNQDDSAVEELRMKNLLLRSELDKAAVGGSGTAYTQHLVSEVKQLRQELSSVETERRKYQTSKRLIDSLVEKSNKLKQDLAQKGGKIEDMKKNESVLKSELAELKQNCEYLLEQNRKLNIEVEEAQSAPVTKPPSVDSFYHEFLFPFGRKREMEKEFIQVHDLLKRIERNVAVNCPSSLLDVRKSSATLDKLKDHVNELLSASEKLEISAATLIKSHASRGRPSTSSVGRTSHNSR